MFIYVGEMFWYDMILKYFYKNGVRKKKILLECYFINFRMRCN